MKKVKEGEGEDRRGREVEVEVGEVLGALLRCWECSNSVGEVVGMF